MTQNTQHVKFRWTENLTCRFIRLRKENRRLFTGRKYSAQTGWDYILRQMREEFPTVMANVHHRVLKKKWSNLLQQYKELKNPVHGDRNKADDISWPFYNAIDEVLGQERGTTPISDDYIDPHEFLCVSVTPEEPTVDGLPVSTDPEIERRNNRSFPEGSVRRFGADCEMKTRTGPGAARKRKRETPFSNLTSATEAAIDNVTSPAKRSRSVSKLRGNNKSNRDKELTSNERNDDGKRSKRSRSTRVTSYEENWDSWTDHRIEQIFEYIKRRDEENRSIMMRVMHAVESIANKL